MSKFISVFFAFWDFCLFAIVVFFEVPLVLSFQGKNRKKNFIPDVLNRCQPDKLKFEKENELQKFQICSSFLIFIFPRKTRRA